MDLNDHLGQGITATIAGKATTVVPLELTESHALLASWSAPPSGDGSLNNPRWVDLGDITAVEAYRYDPAADGDHPTPPGPEDTPDPQNDPTALTYPDPPAEA